MNRPVPLLALALLLTLTVAAAFPPPAHAQFWKKVKDRVKEEVDERREKAEARAESKLDRAIESGADRAEALIENALRCTFGDAACIEEAEEEGRTVVLTDEGGNVMVDQNGDPVTAGAPAPPAAGPRDTPASTPPASSDAVPSSTARASTVAAPALPAYYESPHFFIGGDRWHAGTGQMTDKNWLTREYRGDLRETGFPVVQTVEGRPGHFFASTGRRAAFGFQQGQGTLVERRGEVAVVPRHHPTYRPENLRLFVGSDRRRLAFVHDGDVWRATFDWGSGEIIGEKQVTSVGVFDEGQAFFWYGNDFYIRNPRSQETPIVRVNLSTGALTEMADLKAFQFNRRHQRAFTSPSGATLCRQDPGVLHCYDARRRAPFRVALSYRRSDGSENSLDGIQSLGWSRPVPAPPDGQKTRVWLGENVFAFAGQRAVGRVDLAARRLDVLFEPNPEEHELKARATLPSGRWMDLALTAPYGRAGGPAERRLLLDLTDGSTTPLSLSPDADGAWLDDQTYVYARNDGGLSEIGTWIYRRDSDRTRRVCQARTIPGHALSFPAQGVAYFAARAGSHAVYRVDLDEGDCTKVVGESQLGRSAPRLRRLAGSVQLGLRAGEPRNPWTAAATRGRSLSAEAAREEDASEEAASAPSVPASREPAPEEEAPAATGMERIIAATEDLPPVHRKEIEAAYERARKNYTLSKYFAPACVALTFWEVRKPVMEFEPFESTWNEWASEGGYHECVDRARIVRSTRDRVKEVMKPLPYSEAQKGQLQTCTSKKMADHLTDNPTGDSGAINNLFNNFLSECQEALQ